MNTKPTVSRFADRAKITVQPNTLAKAEEEGDSFKFTTISSGHYACDSGNTTHVIIEKDGKIGCSCPDMTYRCTGTNVCKHITKFLDLDVPPQNPASGELIKKLILMGWVGGKDDLHPAELLKPAPNDSNNAALPELASVICPHCKTRAKRKTREEADAWLVNHLPRCPKNLDNTAPEQQPKPRPTTSVAKDPEIYPDEGSWKPDEDEVAAVAPLAPTSLQGKELPPPELVSPDPTIQPVPPNLATALCNMQKIDLLAVTDSNNPFHNAKYADLASVWAAIRKPLTDNGLAVIQTTEPYLDGITVVTTLLHTSGESFTARLSCEIPPSKPDKNGIVKPNIQGLGSTITYLRRYSLTAMVGVAPIDDDGEAAMGRGDRR